MNKKCFGLMISILLLFIAAMPIQAFAMEGFTAEIPFTVENTPGTVVMEALDGAPAPTVAEFQNVAEGTFTLTFDDPGDYCYRIYQIKGDESDVIYDDTVYNVVVSVFVDENGGLYAVVTLSVDGDAHKPEEVQFKNTLSFTPDHPNPPQTGDNTNLKLYITLMFMSLFGFVFCGVLWKRDHSVTKKNG